MEYRQFEAPDLLPYFTREEAAEQLGLDGYKIDTFSSDYDEFVDEFGTEFEAHGALVGSVHGRPFWGHFVAWFYESLWLATFVVNYVSTCVLMGFQRMTSL
jgi:hypothetical protein